MLETKQWKKKLINKLMTNKQEEILALLIINKGGSFGNSYGLCKMLAWKFKIINCNAIIDSIHKKEYVSCADIKGLEYFSLTIQGKKIIEENKTELIEFLKKEYPSELIIIENL